MGLSEILGRPVPLILPFPTGISGRMKSHSDWDSLNSDRSSVNIILARA
jgi:hypothetical protein